MEQKVLKIKKRDGRLVSFDGEKIKTAVKKAFVENGSYDNNEDKANDVTKAVIEIVNSKFQEKDPSVEEIQDIVELTLIAKNYAKVAKAYILYRQERANKRQEELVEEVKEHKIKVVRTDGSIESFDEKITRDLLKRTSEGLDFIDIDKILADVEKNLHNNIKSSELKNLILNSIKQRIEDHYNYSNLASRVAFDYLYQDILGVGFGQDGFEKAYKQKFKDYVKKGLEINMLNPELTKLDLDLVIESLDPARDNEFMYLGGQTIVDRYLVRDRKRNVIELPQWMWLRVGLGLSLAEKENKEMWAIKFYNNLSNFKLISSTPTLFNSGTAYSQMSSCYLKTVEDDLGEIFKTYSDCAKLSKWSGGIGCDWTDVRATNSLIKGTNGQSQGVVPFLRIFNDVAIAVNQGGKRKGAMAAYMENWHADINEFLELRKNTGDERRRAHDIHPVVWISDLFMKRVKENKDWTLFSPETVPGLHDAYGKEFEVLYEKYELEDLPLKKTIKAVDLWRKMLTMLYETGHPWITFKDPCNVRNPQDHDGVVKCSNLCTEITLNTKKDEVAVCNLASINLSKMIADGKLSEQRIKETLEIGMRMLDNVVDINYYPIPEAENANVKHRPIGLGVMGYQDALYELGIDFASDENIEFADYSMEVISYYAILSSSKLAKEKGVYETYEGSKWERGLLPIDTVDLLEQERGRKIDVDRKVRLDWSAVRDHIKEHGMRNSNCLAIAPTATIANIAGTTPCIEPTFKNIYMKENMSGNFVVINKFLIDDLVKQGIWSKDLLNKIKYYDGSVLQIDDIPADIRRKYKETFEIDPMWILKAAARRAKWIDQSASTNIFVKTTSGKILSQLYTAAWEMGLKTTYYLRTLAASQVTKTVEIKKDEKPVKVCLLNNPDCEACQ